MKSAAALLLTLPAFAEAGCNQNCVQCRAAGHYCYKAEWGSPCFMPEQTPSVCTGQYSAVYCGDDTINSCAPTPAPPPPAPLDGHPANLHKHRIVAYMANWKACPSDDKVAHYTHIMVAFGTTYTNAGANSASCIVGKPVPPCTNYNKETMKRWRAAGKRIIMSIGGWNMNGHWDHCFGKEDSLIQQLKDVVYAPQSDGWEYDGVDIDFEQDNIGGEFLSKMSEGLKLAMPDKEVTHAPMDSDLTAGHKYTEQLRKVADSIDFIMVQYYNGYYRPNTQGYNGAGGCSYCVSETTAQAVARMVALFTTSKCDQTCAQGKVVFGFCNGDCSGTGSNIAGPAAVGVMRDFATAWPENGGAMFWEASFDTGANAIGADLYNYMKDNQWSGSGPTPPATPQPPAATPAPPQATPQPPQATPAPPQATPAPPQATPQPQSPPQPTPSPPTAAPQPAPTSPPHSGGCPADVDPGCQPHWCGNSYWSSQCKTTCQVDCAGGPPVPPVPTTNAPTAHPTAFPTAATATDAPTAYPTEYPTQGSATPPPGGACSCASPVNLWGKCGGQGWTGCTCCVAGAVCAKQSKWYSQCVHESSLAAGREGEEGGTSSSGSITTGVGAALGVIGGLCVGAASVVAVQHVMKGAQRGSGTEV